MSFTGFPVAALDFYDDLEMDNTKSFWEANKAVWKESVEAPMKALMAALEPEFGPAKVFRPYRDVRFAKDKTPYKTHQGAFVARRAGDRLVRRDLRRAARASAPASTTPTGPRLAAIREAMADDKTGKALDRLLKRLEKDGFEVGGEQLKTSPRGYDADHPRIDLLRRKQLFAGRSYGFEPDAIDAGLVDRVRDDWKALRPLVSWLRAVDGRLSGSLVPHVLEVATPPARHGQHRLVARPRRLPCPPAAVVGESRRSATRQPSRRRVDPWR